MNTAFCAVRTRLGIMLSVVTLAAGLAGCSAGSGPSNLQDGIGGATEPESSNSALAPTPAVGCVGPAEGCPCAQEGASVTCAGPIVHTGNYTSCAPGERLCSAGSWGPCLGKAVYQSAGTLTEDYASPCQAGQAVRWGALSLDGLAPANSTIAVRVQTADTSAHLEGAPSVTLADFAGADQSSWTSADVDAVLSAQGLASAAWLRVTLTLTPSATSAATPTVVEWRQASSCVP